MKNKWLALDCFFPLDLSSLTYKGVGTLNPSICAKQKFQVCLEIYKIKKYKWIKWEFYVMMSQLCHYMRRFHAKWRILVNVHSFSLVYLLRKHVHNQETKKLFKSSRIITIDINSSNTCINCFLAAHILFLFHIFLIFIVSS